jgi:hypothetical protein
MRRTGSAVALLGLLLLTSCAITPPVLGGPFPADADGGLSTENGLRTDEGVAALLILNDPESPLGDTTVADYLAQALATAPEVDPASCRSSTVPLVLLDAEASAAGTIFQPPTLFREAPGVDLLVTQVARRFESAEEAQEFLDDLRAAREACPRYVTADGSAIEQEVVEGDFPVAAAGFAITSTAPDGSGASTFEWVLVERDTAISLRADLLDEDAAATLRELADEYAERLASR